MRIFTRNNILSSRQLLILVIIFAAFSIHCSQSRDQKVTKYLEEVLIASGAPGISAAVSVNGEIVYSGGVGYADIENSVPATENTVYRIASISKPVGAIGLMQLYEQGKVKLDDPITEYIPSFPEKEKGIVTVKHILTHTSGIRHYRRGEFGKMKHYHRLADAIEIFKNDTLLFTPGTQYSYTTYGFNLVQGVIESASGMKSDEYLKQNVWDPAGMNSTHYEKHPEIIRNRARGYSKNRLEEIVNTRYTDVSIKYIGGGMISSAVDLINLVNALNSYKILKPETVELMYDRHFKLEDNSFHGLAWSVKTDEDGHKRISHSGGAMGFRSMLIFYPEENLAVAVISNQDFYSVGSVAQVIADMYLGRELIDDE